MKKVNVLVSTYNGEKYIHEQFDSLLQQTYGNIDVYVRDDGSKDNTVAVIDEYCEKSNSNIRFIKVETDNKNLGYPDCFWELVKIVPKADYYAFCDQDDWWYPEKIENAVSALEKIDASIPAMTYCQFDYYNQEMEYLRKGDTYTNLDFLKGMYYTFAPGFTQVVNRNLVEKLDFNFIFEKHLAHDIWCQWIATSLGVVIQQEKVLAKYRRHEKAVTSSNKGKFSSLKYWWEKEIKGDEMKKWKQSLIYFYEAYENEFPDSLKKELILFTKKTLSISEKMKKVFYKEKLRPTKGGDLALRILFLLNVC